tara:strand:+ start:587 stop:1081 length:495 start_codon:yes stop_codon:yes gene_type:complete
MTALYELTNEFRKVAYELDSMDDLHPQILLDTLEAYRQPVENKVVQIAKYIKNIDADIQAYKTEEERLAKKRKSLQNKMDGIKQYAIHHMKAANILITDSGILTVKVGLAPPSTIIDSIANLPEKYKSTKELIHVDKNLIKQDIKKGLQIAGAHLEQKDILQIK